MTIEQAITLHRAGKLQEAESLYQAVLVATPGHPEANYNLGMLTLQSAQPAAALPYFIAALEADPACRQYWLSYLEALLQAGQLADAHQMLEFARQQGLEGVEVEALALRIAAATETSVLQAFQPEAQTPPIDPLLALFDSGDYAVVLTQAASMTEQFPDYWAGWMLSGMALKQLGRSEQALGAIQKALALSPDSAAAYFNLGVIFQELNRQEEASAAYRQALQLNPAYAEAHYNLGSALQSQGLSGQAEASYRQALRCKADFAEAHYNLGTLLQGMGRLNEASASYHSALLYQPDYAEAHLNLGIVSLALGQLEQAEISLHQALALRPEHAEIAFNLGNTLKAAGRIPEAQQFFEQALHLRPDYYQAYSNLGLLLHEQGDYAAAAQSLNCALLIKPQDAVLHYNLANTLKELERPAEACARYLQALELQPDYALAAFNLANTLRETGRFHEAEARYRQALQSKPDYAEAYCNLGFTVERLGRLAEAEDCYRKALQIAPDFVVAHSNLIFAMDLMENRDASALYAERQRWDAAHAAHLQQYLPYSNIVDPLRRLRIGYVSGDFREHSAPKAFGGMLTHYDRSNFQVIAYDNGKGEGDRFTGIFRQQVSGWRNIHGWSDEAVAELIREDQIDILVDLSGHSAGNRLLVFARKPAPIQISAWGYAAGTGMQAMDIFFADALVLPEQDKKYFTEQVRYLPCILGSWFGEPFPEVNALPALSNRMITFGSLNRLVKFSDSSYRVWSELLRAIPHSRLLLKSAELNDAETRAQVAAHFTVYGVAAERIVMLGKTDWHTHVATYQQIDLVLDPFPQGGGVTALEGLMMGVPMLALCGATIAGRTSASMMTTLGLTDWIARTEAEYVTLAIKKAGDLPALARLRQHLRGIYQRSVLGDQAAYARAVEQQYREIWQEWCQGASQRENCDLEMLQKQVVALHRAGRLAEARQRLELAHENGLAGAEFEALAARFAPVQQQPGHSEIEALVALFSTGRLKEAEASALLLTQRFPQHGFGWKALGAVYKQLGQDAEALLPMQKAAQLSPEDVEAQYNLGAVWQGLGRLEEAMQCYQHALQLDSTYADAHGNLGVILNQLGRPAEAEQSLLRAISLRPNNAETHGNLGVTLHELGKYAEAEASYRRALLLNPDNASVQHNLGNTLKSLGRRAEAAVSFRNALLLAPAFAEAHHSLGMVYQTMGCLAEAEASLKEAVKFKPAFAEAYNNLGNLLRQLRRLEEAEACYRQALQLSPAYAEAHNNLGATLQDQNRLAEAEDAYRRALQYKPAFAEASNNLGSILRELGRPVEAEMSCRRALQLKPELVEAHSNLGITLLNMGRLEEAEACIHTALQLAPRNALLHSTLLFTQDLMLNKDAASLLKERKRWDTLHAAALWQDRVYANTPDPQRRLRIGYVSADFREHSASKAFGGMLTHYERANFEVYAYANFMGRGDQTTELFKQNVSVWRNIYGLPDEVAAQLILDDRIDLLVDLSGHSAGHRLLVFARKPAPIQITAWGYAAGTGMRAMEVFFADPVVLPPEEQHYFTEQIRYLPCVVSSSFNQPFPPIQSLPALQNGFVTFGSLNRLAKISDRVYRSWAAILLAVPNSRLMLKAAELEDAATRAKIVGYFTQAGVAAERILMLGKTSWQVQMQTYNEIDLVLDPFPQGGGVTALEGLMMGVPMIALLGSTIAGRTSASLMTVLGLEDWIAPSLEAYVALAVQKAGDLQALSRLREQLRTLYTASVLGDQVAYVRAVELEYRQLWRVWCAAQ